MALLLVAFSIGMFNDFCLQTLAVGHLGQAALTWLA
jgi:hypothetical protein